MKKLEPIELIDEVLNFIKTGQHWKTLKVIHIHFTNENIELLSDDLTRILLKLMDDNYIAYSEVDDYTKDHYIATYSGMLFHGYERQKEIDDINIAIAKGNEDRVSRNDQLLVYYTLLAGIVAGLLLLWQIFLFFFPHYSDYPYHFWLEKDWIITPLKK